MTSEELDAAIAHARSWIDDPGAPVEGADEADDIATRFARALLAVAANRDRLKAAALNAANLLEARTDKSMRKVAADFVRREVEAALQ